MSQVDKTSAIPPYLQIKQIVRERILRGEIPAATRLAGERRLAEEFDVSAVTMSRALTELEREGLVTRRPGGGTYVCSVVSNGTGRLSPPRDQYTLWIDTGRVFDPEANYYMGPLLTGVHAVAQEHGCAIRFLKSPQTAGCDIPSMGPNEGLLMIAPAVHRHDEIAALAAAGTPMVLLGGRFPDLPIATVDSDNVGGAQQAIKYLLRLGHRRIVLVTLTPEMSNWSDRVEGYRIALEEQGLSLQDDLILHAIHAMELGDEATSRLQELLLSTEAPTAVFAIGYYLALDAVARVRAMGFHVPNDVSIVGFDDPVSAAYLSPPLTTVRQPLQEMGRRAAERLLEVTASPANAGGLECFPTMLVIRGSCRSTHQG